MENKEGVKFIRKGGRVIPIKGDSSSQPDQEKKHKVSALQSYGKAAEHRKKSQKKADFGFFAGAAAGAVAGRSLASTAIGAIAGLAIGTAAGSKDRKKAKKHKSEAYDKMGKSLFLNKAKR